MAFKKFEGLTALHRNLEHVIVTAHRGASGCYPENTLLAMRKAVEWGADIIEFDLRVSKDGVPIVLHDETLNRTSDLEDRPEDFDLAALRCGNFSYYRFGVDALSGRRLKIPAYVKMQIPTFEEVLQEFRGKVGMNIQVYAEPAALQEIYRLYKTYHMQDQGYLTIASMEAYESICKFDGKIEVCFTPPWNLRGTQEALKQCKELGCRFVQPVVEHSGPDCYRLCRELGLRANSFYADTDLNIRLLLAQGANGILSNRADVVCDTLNELGRL
ncbi:MAG: glycerophosphodiester phosphodiesterase family protein [Lentisphaeria bacterium]